jgi:hypothetical protein
LDGYNHRCLFGITEQPPLACNILMETIPRKSARCDPQHVSADSSVGRRDSGYAYHLPCVSHDSLAALLPLDLPQNKVRSHRKYSSRHISLLTCYIGSIITRVYYSALSVSLPQTLIRTLPPHPSRLAALLPTLSDGACPQRKRSLARTYTFRKGYVHCLGLYGHPPKRCLPLRWRASPLYPRI